MVKYIYDGWGNQSVNVLDESAAVIANLNPFRYRSYYYDVETGLYFLKTRYYDSEIGRFMTIDGISYINPDSINGLNLYAYCGNNPIMAVDPNGTEWWNPTTWDWDNIGNWSDVGRFVGGLVISLAGLGLMALSIKSGNVASLSPGITLGLSVALYGGFVMASSWDSEIKTDMARIHWNPFNTDDDMSMTNKVSFYKGQAVVLQDFAESSFSAGIMFLHQDQKDSINTVKHEWGHFVQLLMFGPVLYAALFAAPSVAYWHYCKRTEDWSNYYNVPWEKLADDFGGVSRP